MVLVCYNPACTAVEADLVATMLQREGSSCPGFQAHREPDVLDVQMPRQVGRKQRHAKGIVPNLNPASLTAAKESDMSMSVPHSLLLKSIYEAH